MLRVCPRCRGTTEHFLCPRCGIHTEDREAPALPGPAAPVAEAADGLSPAAGLLVGLLLAQGLYYALRHLMTALLLANGDPRAEADFWAGWHGLVMQQTAQALALLVGGMIAAAGQRHGVLLGAVLGVVNVLLLLGMHTLVSQPPAEIILYGLPLLHIVLGAAGGLLGSRIWQPAPAVPAVLTDLRPSPEVLTTAVPDRPAAVEVHPLPWARLIIGSAVAAGGTLGAHVIRDFVLAASGSGGHQMIQSPFVTWIIAVAAQMIGGGVAGANTRAGATYGFWAGLLAAGLLVVARTLADLPLQTHEFLAWLLDLGNVPAGSSAALLLQGAQAVMLGLVGGWLGGQILPMIQPKAAFDADA